MRVTDIEQQLAQAWLVGIVLSAIGTGIMLTVLYFVIRCGVRDGMLDAQKGVRSDREPARHRATSIAHLPDIRAD